MTVPPTTIPPTQADLNNKSLFTTAGEIGAYLLPISTFASSIINGEYYDTAKIAIFALIQKIELVAMHNFFQRIRPDGLVGGSFPSDATSYAFFAVGYYFRKAPAVATLAAVSAATLVGISRYATGLYWTTDILAGAALGMLNGFLASVKYLPAESLPRRVDIHADVGRGEASVNVERRQQ